MDLRAPGCARTTACTRAPALVERRTIAPCDNQAAPIAIPGRDVELHTPNLTLVLQSTQEILAWIAAMNAAERAEVSPDWIARVRASATPDPWTHFFAMVHTASGAAVGSCGFKGPPGTDATVEIAYGINPAHQGQGHATEAARALVAFAFASAPIRAVRAHTRPESNASGRVLTKYGFQRTGEVVDPEDGLVWRWEIARASVSVDSGN